MKKLGIAILALALIYLLGPTPSTPEYAPALPDVPNTPGALETYVEAMEQGHKVKPDNEARILWNDAETKAKTEYAIVYLHGFSASEHEGFPTHVDFAKKFGCNMFLARLSDHGIDTTDAMYALTADRLWNSAKEAYAIGKSLGKKVILMSTSTGGTLALKLAATYPEIAGCINFSPNIEVNDPLAFLLNNPWGLQISKMYFGGNFRELEASQEARKYWYAKYRLESVVALQELIETSCTEETFRDVRCPVFTGAYYKDEIHQDPVVRVDAMRWMHSCLSTPEEKKRFVEFPDAGDHVIAYGPKSGAQPEVFAAASIFAEQVLGMKPLQ